MWKSRCYSAILVTGDNSTGFERNVALAADTIASLDHRHVISGEGRIRVAALNRCLPGNIAAPLRAFQQNIVVLPIRMDEPGIGVQRSLHRQQGGQRFNLDFNQPGGRPRLFERVGGDGRERLAMVADNVAGEDRVIGNADPEQCLVHRPP